MKRIKKWLNGLPPEIRLGIERVCYQHFNTAPAPSAPSRQKIREYYEDERATACHADDDGECAWKDCPQLRDGEPKQSHRHCPLDSVTAPAPSEDSARLDTDTLDMLWAAAHDMGVLHFRHQAVVILAAARRGESQK